MKSNLYHFRFFISILVLLLTSNVLKSQFERVDIAPANGVYSFSYNQTPDNLVPRYPSVIGTYLWESSPTPNDADFTPTGITSANYAFSGPLTTTTYFRRKITIAGNISTSNILKIEVVSTNWEDRNYKRVHNVLISGQSSWQTIDALPIGQKLEGTSYFDGLGRNVQRIIREAASPDPATPTVWRDVVKFNVYDDYGREQKRYLSYTTASTPGKYKTNAETAQAQYYTTNFTETSPFSAVSYDNSPINRLTNVKNAGTSWAAGQGNSLAYQINEAAEDVKIFTIGYTAGAIPVMNGVYPNNTLYKSVHTNEQGKKVIEYTTVKGQMILKKVQSNDNPSLTYGGWICTYNVYDEFDRLRFVIEPEGVNYLSLNAWSFAGTNGQAVLDEQCTRYEYDEKGRIITRKAGGSLEVLTIYDARDRVVFTQDGNQRSKSPVEWLATLYDELDRPVIETIYRTAKSVSDLKNDIGTSFVTSTVNVTNPASDLDNLVVDERAPGVTAYNAKQNIELVPGFESGPSDDFVAEINGAAQTSGATIVATAYKNPITNADLNNSSVTTILKYFFYDTYSFPNVKPFQTSSDNLLAYPTGGDPIARSERTVSRLTGTMIRVLNSNTFLASTMYYDDKGRLVQTLDDNIKSGEDIVTTQYQFDHRVLSSNRKHSAANSGYYNYSIVTKNVYDNVGRLTSIDKKFGDNAFKSVAAYSLDDAGKLQSRRLAPGYTGSGKTEMESLGYTYNLHGSLTGINKHYALKTPGQYNKWGNFFGLVVGYDNADGFFSNAKLNGQATGLVWNTMGDDAQRKLDFTYDNVQRLSSALFNERQTPGDPWSNTQTDFSVTGTTGKITYDLNGNLTNMIQKGVVPGIASPVTVDNLTYSYANLSNRLTKVVDNGTLSSNNGKLGDFTDGTNSTNDDYVYDDNGNLVIDLNKDAKELGNQVGADGIRYNQLDKPEEIHISGKGTIKIIYDASGNKLQRSFTPDGSSLTTTTTFIKGFLYNDDKLQFIAFEEGRVRVITNIATNNGYDALNIDGTVDLPDGKRGAFDYFIMDQLRNVRMVLTDGIHTGSNACTMETSRAANEEPLFGKVDANGNPASGNEVQARFAVSGIPGQSSGGGWQNGTIGNHVSRIGNLAASKLGPNSLLKVMAGDQITATALYYYANPVTNSTGATTLLTNFLQSLGQAIAGNGAASGITKTSSTAITSLLNSSVPFSEKIAPDANNAAGTNPKAYLGVMFFDERFNFVADASSTVRVTQSGTGATPLVFPTTKAPKNGYAFIYVSNESNEMVYFDNLQVSHERGRILEENHFYAFGLKIAGLSAQKLSESYEGEVRNRYLYQGAFAELDTDIGWQDFTLRNYDAQTGKFVQADPFEQFPSQYTGMGNDPVNLVDPSGGASIIPCPGISQMSLFFMRAGDAIGKGLNTIGSLSRLWVSFGVAVSSVGADIYNRSVQFKIIDRQLTLHMTEQAGSGDNGTNLSDPENGGNSESQKCPDCPPGYARKPKSPNDKPHFFEADQVALYWAWQTRGLGITGAKEFSSEIRSFSTAGAKGTATLYYATSPVRFKDDQDPDAQSPGLRHPLHGRLPVGHQIVGHLHLHWSGSEREGDIVGDNRTWSPGDMKRHAHKDNTNMYFYLLGATGQLHAKYPADMPPITGPGYFFPDAREGSYRQEIDKGFYDSQKTQPALCPCYKQ